MHTKGVVQQHAFSEGFLEGVLLWVSEGGRVLRRVSKEGTFEKAEQVIGGKVCDTLENLVRQGYCYRSNLGWTLRL